ncbi:pentatricopeptide repeat-containing protein At4g18520, chloroplastic [Selaginella moellendorffii]|uniref:pentatricopeptide repeat-containing protein At4g18520, chloroplastic n=1 Tax=Selaginella moellendorffii TaxID=88036 RepID=UPI000D1CD9F8|nr:pentatricopeptide repeat-containing protein At4g18520, chloroplastic [Selaginella moellendorffii]|eukprot:XP_024538783.1 pentatricopeptide repeat-containing protein At4g18520, chloroplastic [Selaginella moellendorffii]
MIDHSCGRHFFGRVHRGKEENRGSSGNIDVLGRFPSRASGICQGQIPDFVQEERSKDAIGASKKDGVERWVPWNSLILKYLEQGRCEEAVRMIEETCLEEEESVPSESLIVAALNRLSSPRMLEAGERIHCVASCLNLVESKRKRVGVALLGMYVRCGSVESARKLFDSMAVERNGECWTVMISAYVRRGWINEALLLFKKSLLEGVRPSEGTFIALLHACSRPASLDQGKKLHRLLEEAGFQESIAPSLATSLIKMYGKCGSLDEAWKVMEKIESRDVELWTVMIASLSHFGKLDRAFELLKRMDLEGDRPSKMTFMAVLRACKDHPEARQVGGVLHGLIRERGLESDVGVGTSLVNMYARWGDAQQAQEVFSQIEARDVSSWNCLLAAYSRCSRQEQALVLYREMMLEGVKPDRLTLNTVIDVCASLKDLEQGSRIHQQIASSGFASDLMLDTALITFYGRCGKLEAALEIFEALPARDNVTWNTMIASLNDHSSPEAAMGFFQRMQQEGMAPSRVTLLTVLGLCGSVGEAKLVHSCVRESGFEQDSEVKNTLITAYGRCGGLPQALEIFEALPRKIESSWNAMMGAYAAQGKPRAALELFHRMVKLEQMIQPSVSTIILALNSCRSLADGGDGGHAREVWKPGRRQRVLPQTWEEQGHGSLDDDGGGVRSSRPLRSSSRPLRSHAPRRRRLSGRSHARERPLGLQPRRAPPSRPPDLRLYRQ